jgi:ATP-dependent helicase YprA (DUF1998 family)
MDYQDVPTVPTLEKRLKTLRGYSKEDIFELSRQILPTSKLPTDFLIGLTEEDLAICLLATLICWFVTGGAQVPRAMQLRAVLSDRHRKDSLIAAGTGSGKTLPIALNILLDDPAKKLVTITFSPLKRLQVTQENDFNSRYGIPTVVINQDTPDEDKWYQVHFTRIKIKSLKALFMLGTCF